MQDPRGNLLKLYVILHHFCLTIVRIDSHAYICCRSIEYYW